MTVKTVPTPPMYANTYIVTDEHSGECVVIDIGAYTKDIEAALGDSSIKKLKYILLTHGHCDHIDGVYELKKLYPDVPVCIHEKDEQCLHDDLRSLARGFGFPAREKLNADKIFHGETENLHFGNGEIKVIHTPGHTEGGVSYLIGDCLFTGDTLFYRSVGRTDFPGGDFSVLERSVEKLYSLEGDLKVYPGHERSTTLDSERRFNTYVRQK